MRFDTLCLDAGGVLVFPNWKRASETLARHGVDVSADALAAAEPRVKFEIDTANTILNDPKSIRNFFESVLTTAGVTLNAAAEAALRELRQYHDEHNLWEVVPGDVVSALRRFRELGLCLVVISNANGTLHSCLQRLGMAMMFDAIFDSFHEGIEKPDPRLFLRALDRVGAAPATALHVGDMYSVDVRGARAAGVHPVLLDPHDLYLSCDCSRVRTLAELADGIAGGTI